MKQLSPTGSSGRRLDASARHLRPGSRLGRYELLFPVGKGGMATVWAARLLSRPRFSKLVAIKTILPHLAEDPGFEKMFLDEARVASGILHPNVCDVHELGEQGGVLYAVMEWVNGDSLLQVLRTAAPSVRDPIEPRIAARIASEACAGLHAAHELVDDAGQPLDVVHRDVSPHNILMSLEGMVKVADFGVVKARGQIHTTTAGGTIKGKLSYMAPEQVCARPVDRRADIFSMGCVLNEIRTGQKPFRGENEAGIMRAIIDGTFEAPDALLTGYPPELSSIIQRALAPDPGHRFATAEQMRFALEEWLERRGPPITSIHMAALVRERLGARLQRRAEQLRAAIRGVDDSEASDPDGESTRAKSGRTPARAVPQAPTASRDVDVSQVRGEVVVDVPTPTFDRTSTTRLTGKGVALGLVALAFALVGSLVWSSDFRRLRVQEASVEVEARPAAMVSARATAALPDWPSVVDTGVLNVPPAASTLSSTVSGAAKPGAKRDPRHASEGSASARDNDYDIPSLR